MTAYSLEISWKIRHNYILYALLTLPDWILEVWGINCVNTHVHIIHGYNNKTITEILV